ncbi:MAG: hypothetical protein RR415_12860 [Ruthenibacterium sp.]
MKKPLPESFALKQNLVLWMGAITIQCKMAQQLFKEERCAVLLFRGNINTQVLNNFALKIQVTVKTNVHGW